MFAPSRIGRGSVEDAGAVTTPAATTRVAAAIRVHLSFRRGTGRAYQGNMRRLGIFVTLCTASCVFAAAPDVRDLVRRSVENNERNWKAAPQYSFTEKDVITSKGRTTRRTWRVTMIAGS